RVVQLGGLTQNVRFGMPQKDENAQTSEHFQLEFSLIAEPRLEVLFLVALARNNARNSSCSCYPGNGGPFRCRRLHMRGRSTRPLMLDADDIAILQALALCRSRPWFQVQHARMLLGIAVGQRVQTLARQLQFNAATVWRICRGYEQHGLDVVPWEAPRPGRPQQLSPPTTCSDRGVGLFGTHCQRVAYHPLEQFRLGPSSGQRWRRRVHQPAHGPTDPARRRPAAASYALLEDGSPHRGLQGTDRESAVVLRKCPEFGRARALGRLH